VAPALARRTFPLHHACLCLPADPPYTRSG